VFPLAVTRFGSAAAGEIDMGSRWPLLTPLLFTLLVVPLLAAGPTGTITGTVTDPSQAVVPRARITVLNLDTNATRDALTNDDGDYTVALLPVGRYRVSVERPGFRKSFYSEVALDVDQTVRVDFALEIGLVPGEVEVKDTPPLVQTDTSTLGQVLNGRQVRELPLNERNFLSFALLVPGSHSAAEGSENSTQGGAISVNGAREQSNSFLLDGVDNNDPYINQYVALPSVDAIQEFKVQSSDYSAEFGRGGGAQVNVILKSGSNEFHGGVFEFFRNRHVDARNFFDFPACTPASVPGTCGGIPRFDRNQFGGTLGGPIRKNKMFFFGAYEGLRLRQAATRESTVPSQMQKMEALGALPAAFINPAGRAILNLYPAANVGSDLVNSNTFVSSPVIRNSENLTTGKVDHHATDGDVISAHFTRFDEDRFNPFDPVNAFTTLPGYGSYTLNNGQNAGLGWTHVFNPSATNEFRLGFNRMRAGAFQQHYGADVSRQLGFPDVLANPVDLGVPNVGLPPFEGIGEPVNYPQDRHDTTAHLSDNLSWISGRHQFKFGADIRTIQVNNYLDFVARGEWLFNQSGQDPVTALAQLLSGVPDYAVAVRGDTFNSLRSTGSNVYIQDDIHVVPRFLLNVGLRYEYNSPPVETHNRFSVPDLSSASATCSPAPNCQFIQAGAHGIPRATYSPTHTDFAPRIGIAWRPLKSQRWVVRSAYGIFYDVGIFNISIFPRANPPFYDLSAYINNPSNPFVIQNILTQPGLAIVQPNRIAPNFRDGYVQQWNVDLQYELGPNWMLDMAYVGSRGTHLADVRDLNQTNPRTGLSPYPQFSSLLYVQSGSSSSYNSMQFRSEKRVGQDLAFLVSYTWSKSIDDVSSVFAGSVGSGLPQNSNNLSAERAVSDFDARHRLAISAVYDLPFGKLWARGAGWRKALLDHWQLAGILTAQSGSPFTVNLAAAQSGSAIAAFGNPARPDLIAGPFQAGPVMANPNPACHATISHGGSAADVVHQPGSWFDPCAFAEPALTPVGLPVFGTSGRNILIGPAFSNLDFSLSKSIPLRTENHRLQIRGEFFNLTNHPNLDIPNHVLGSPTFGQVLSANAYGNKPPRQIQLGLKYIF
jgi:hypothetical protein